MPPSGGRCPDRGLLTSQGVVGYQRGTPVFGYQYGYPMPETAGATTLAAGMPRDSDAFPVSRAPRSPTEQMRTNRACSFELLACAHLSSESSSAYRDAWGQTAEDSHSHHNEAISDNYHGNSQPCAGTRKRNRLRKKGNSRSESPYHGPYPYKPPRGLRGPPGPPGEAGPPGSRGEQGLQGIPVSDSLRLAHDVVLIKSSRESVYPVHRDPRGAPGVAGPAGPAGQPGPSGPQGLPGVAGREGPQGLQGIPGSQGDPGTAGRDGRDGRDGADGRDGRDGRDGVDGRDGADGKDGVDGRDGEMGSADLREKLGQRVNAVLAVGVATRALGATKAPGDARVVVAPGEIVGVIAAIAT
ncbi:hypothetical protein DL769_007289 [Monosporascus sp. CRB-8-3]|nr:hypothetical protein DL769_007289 [Monosporascus sp. CRB-8-3]